MGNTYDAFLPRLLSSSLTPIKRGVIVFSRANVLRRREPSSLSEKTIRRKSTVKPPTYYVCSAPYCGF